MLKILFSFLGVFALTAAFLLSSTQANPADIGAEAPRLSAVTQDGKEIDLGAVYQKGLTLVYFYPKADTPGCTKQACSLRDAYQTLQEKGVQVIGVSVDSPADQKAFAEKHQLPFTLIADEKGEVAKAFGVPVNRLGFASRQAFLVDKDGRILWRDLDASTEEQAADVLKALEAIRK